MTSYEQKRKNWIFEKGQIYDHSFNRTHENVLEERTAGPRRSFKRKSLRQLKERKHALRRKATDCQPPENARNIHHGMQSKPPFISFRTSRTRDRPSTSTSTCACLVVFGHVDEALDGFACAAVPRVWLNGRASLCVLFLAVLSNTKPFKGRFVVGGMEKNRNKRADPLSVSVTVVWAVTI